MDLSLASASKETTAWGDHSTQRSRLRRETLGKVMVKKLQGVEESKQGVPEKEGPACVRLRGTPGAWPRWSWPASILC